jgi:hypothetical protein
VKVGKKQRQIHRDLGLKVVHVLSDLGMELMNSKR